MTERYELRAKRALDLATAIVTLVLLSPLIAVVAGAVRIFLGTPIIFRQIRPGLGGHPFTLYKFRSMSDATDPEGNLLPDDLRLTKFGRFLRSTSLDELPELINVVKGDMSLVGPRPLLMGYLERYSATQARRHEVRPGITGLAQVNGRNAISWEKKFELDVWYVDHVSFSLDLKILLQSIGTVISRQKISHPGAATMHEFIGQVTEQQCQNKS